MHNALHNKKKHSYETYEIIYLLFEPRH